MTNAEKRRKERQNAIARPGKAGQVRMRWTYEGRSYGPSWFDTLEAAQAQLAEAASEYSIEIPSEYYEQHGTFFEAHLEAWNGDAWALVPGSETRRFVRVIQVR